MPKVDKLPAKGHKHVLVSRKRARIVSSDDDTVLVECKATSSKDTGADTRRKINSKKSSSESDNRTLAELRQLIKKGELERKKLSARLSAKKDQLKESQSKLATQTRALDKAKKTNQRLRKIEEKLENDKQEIEAGSKRFKKKMENYRTKLHETEAEKTKLENRLASLQITKSNGCGSSSKSPTTEPMPVGSGESNFFQDMMDNFRELAENQLMCVVCSEVFVDAVSVNCGHTFCDHCITEWRKKKNNCPVCRANIKSINPVKVLDEYSDKVYEQFVSEGGKQTRSLLKEERKKESEKNKHKMRRGLDVLDIDDDSGNSIDSDETLEIRYNSDFDTDVSDEVWRVESPHLGEDVFEIQDDTPQLNRPPGSSFFAQSGLSLIELDDTDSSDDEDFSILHWRQQRHRIRQRLSTSSSSSNSSLSTEDDDSSSSTDDDDSTATNDDDHDNDDAVDYYNL